MSGLVRNWLALECLTSNLANTHTYLFCDNTSALGRTINLISVSSVVAGHILRFLGMHIHSTQASHIAPIRIAREDNDMTDVISRAFQKGGLFAAKKISLQIFKSISPSPRGTLRPSSPFLKIVRNN